MLFSSGNSKGSRSDAEALPRHDHACVVGQLLDKKPDAINWSGGRGKDVVAETIVPGKVVRSVLKTTVEALCNLNTKKNLIVNAMIGSIGAPWIQISRCGYPYCCLFVTGQDPVQNVESLNCVTLMEPTNDGEDLLITVSMPSIEVGTVLDPQGSILEMPGIKGAYQTSPGGRKLYQKAFLKKYVRNCPGVLHWPLACQISNMCFATELMMQRPRASESGLTHHSPFFRSDGHYCGCRNNWA